MYIQKNRDFIPLSIFSIKNSYFEIGKICNLAGYDNLNVNAFFFKQGFIMIIFKIFKNFACLWKDHGDHAVFDCSKKNCKKKLCKREFNRYKILCYKKSYSCE